MAQQAKKSHKAGRNTDKCTKYSKGKRREVNKIRRLIRHCQQYPTDNQSKTALDQICHSDYLAYKTANKQLTAYREN